jgi:hypothetical protein
VRDVAVDRSRDAGVLQAYVRELSPESRYNRFFAALNELLPAELDHVIHLDRRYELALLAETSVDGAPMMIGEARYVLAPDRLECEFALSDAGDRRSKGSACCPWPTSSAERGASARDISAVTCCVPTNAGVGAQERIPMADVPRDARLVRIMKNLALTRVSGPCEVLRASDRNGLRRVRVPAAIGQGLIALMLCSIAFVDAD